jgi:hypothetical protein
MKKIKVAAILFVAFALSGWVAVGTARAGDYELLEIDSRAVKWGEPRLGAGAVVSYAFASEIYRFPDARNCGAIKPLALRSRSGPVVRIRIAEEFRKAAKAWSAVAAIRFVPAATEKEADLLVGAQVEPLGRAFANVTPATNRAVGRALQTGFARTTSGVMPAKMSGNGKPLQRLQHSLICLNADLPWKFGFDGDLEVYDLRHTFMHEIGHVLGLNHVRTGKSVMNYRYDESVSSLQPGDRSGAALLYGGPARR